MTLRSMPPCCRTECPAGWTPPLRPPSSPTSGKQNAAWRDVRRAPARSATAALQNPLAPGAHGVFGLKTFTTKTPVPRKPKSTVEPKPADSAEAQSANGKATGAEPKKKVRAAAAVKKNKPAAAKKPAKKPSAPA